MLNIKINLEDNIKEFKVNDMEDLVSQITNKLKDNKGNPISEEDRKNAYWMSVELDAAKIQLEDNMELELKCIANNNMVRNNNIMNRLTNFIRGDNNTKSTSFILKAKSEQDEYESKLTQQAASFVRPTLNLVKRSRYYQW